MSKKLSEDFLRKRSKEILAEKAMGVSIFDPAKEEMIPRFEPAELVVGKFLGSGGFCTVHEIMEVKLNPSGAGAKAEEEADKKKSNTLMAAQDRDFISKHYIRDNQARYAIKKVTDSLYQKYDPQHFVSGVIDLGMEVKFLSVLSHPHIIKMRALATMDSCHKDFFIVLDRLYGTLDNRIADWKKQSKKVFTKKEDKMNTHLEKLTIMYDICSALLFLHKNQIIYRDLKPENIGFDVRDDVKIFDFGLAKEKSSADRVQGSDLYYLTNDTGSPRYMAPEVALGKPYNEKCDVYGFTLLLWHVIECIAPFHGYTFAKMKDVYTKNDRPKVNSKLSDNIKNIFAMGWNADISKRPSLDDLSDMIRKEIREFGGDSELDLTDRTEKSMRKLRL